MVGLLFAFSNFVMRAMAGLPPAAGVEACSESTARSLFRVLFPGTPALCMLSAVMPLRTVATEGRFYLWAGAPVYLIGVPRH